MNLFLTILLSILEMIVILSVLISLHELGHLAMAKAFHVYCFEYSIGFGPKILRKKRKNGETYFRIGALPFGGYVSMYGEAESVPPDVDATALDPSRSLINKKKWQQAIIMVAGVVTNFVLGLILIFVSDIAFPVYYFGYGGESVGAENAKVEACYAPISSLGDKIIQQIDAEIADREELHGYESSDFYVAFPALYRQSNGLNDFAFIYLGDDGQIDGSVGYFIPTYYPSSLVDAHSLVNSVRFYEAEEVKESDSYYEAFKAVGLSNRLADKTFEASPDAPGYQVSKATDGTKATFSLRLVGLKFKDSGGENAENSPSASYLDIYNSRSVKIALTFTAKDGAWMAEEGYEMNFGVISEYYGWNGAWAAWASDVPYACGAIVKGFASLFVGGWKNLSGIVGMTAALPALTATGGAHQIFFFAGLISINLAFFNLLPFPGLDGWQLLSIAIEGITRKRIPTKVKSIVSYVGLGLLFLLIIAITIKDILMLFV